MKKFLCMILLMIFAAGYVSAQEKWVQDRVMQKRYVGPAPTVPVMNTNYIESTITRYLFSPFGINAVGPSFRVLPNSNQQDEVILSSCRQNPLLLFGSANTSVGSTYGQGMYISTNGGLNWYGNDILPNLPGSTSDPAPMIDKDGRFIFTTLNTSSSAATMIANYSTNYGATWSAYTTITSVSSDKNFAASDDAPTSPYYGRSYAVWSNMSLSNPPIVISYTTNGGVSWSSPSQINTPPSGHYSQGCDIAIGPAGQVYVTWAAPVSASPYTEDFAGFARSTNGGVSWTVTENAFDMNGIRTSSYNGWGVRTNSFPRISIDRSGGPRNGWIYIVETDVNIAPAGSDGDVVLHRSTDGGATWSAGIRVNQDPINNGKVQFFPAIRVDEMGGVNVVYYDNRNFASVGDSASVFMSRSIDGGTTWTDVQVSDHNWKPKGESGMGSYMGDYIGITSANGKIFPFWFDDKTGSMQAWTCIIELGPSISHTPLTNTELISGSRAVNCTITPAGSGINPSTVKLYYAKNSTTFTAVTMTNSGGTNWTANLPLSGAGTYNYYLSATDSLSRTATSPAGAPANYYSFIASTDTVKPVITHTPLSNTPKIQWPVTVAATVTDNIGVDSVWVRWRKNSTTTKQFKLLNTGGSNYSAAFNSDTSQVAIGDTIYYRVIARDISSMHNADSTALYSFKIINQVTVTVGTGTTSSNFPFTTYWMDGRTNYLYFASELNTGSGYITSIGFNVISADPGAMNEFTIKMQNTTATSISGFTADGWTNCLTTTYTVPGSGWQMINLTTPFAYTGGNLLVEVCYNNSSYTNYSTVYASATTGDFWGRYNDLSSASGCGYTAWTSSATPPGKANTRFVMNPGPTSVTPIGTTVPETYSLAQNYPNPFNPVTKINFAIPKQGFVTMKVYDMLGREVSKLVNEVKQAGIYSVDFDATRLSSGVYFYKLEVNGFTDVKRMVLVK